MKEHAVIVAGGSGTRMRSAVPKQFLLLKGRPILMHTLEAFKAYSPNIHIVLVLPRADIDRWEELCKLHGFNLPVTLQEGGNSRFQSVKRGLEKVDDGLVAVHDGVRPLVLPDSIGASFRLAGLHGSAVAAVRLKESIRVVDKDSTHAVDRSQYRLIQTPQTFQVSLLKEAYGIEEDSLLTDDASVVERSGHRISLFEGNYENIKITTPEDLVLAEALLKAR